MPEINPTGEKFKSGVSIPAGSYETGIDDGPVKCAKGAARLLCEIHKRAKDDNRLTDFNVYWVNRPIMRWIFTTLGHNTATGGKTKNAARSGGMV